MSGVFQITLPKKALQAWHVSYMPDEVRVNRSEGEWQTQGVL